MDQSAMWQWDKQSRTYGNYGNANQWTVNAGLVSLARESTQNSNDARVGADPAELVYSFIRLTGHERDAFLDALAWPQLRSHLDAMGGEAGGAVAAGQIRAGLDAVEGSRSLALLRVADYGCRGLTGPEFPDHDVNSDHYGNFIKLCRLDLFSGKEKAAGGSFGLGKAVYWRFSRLQTVLFNSVLAERDAVDGRTDDRVFGVNQGVVHRHGGKGYQGRGFFGLPDPQGHVASVWNDRRLVDALHLSRSGPRPGTTALLLGFYDPDRPELALDGQDLTALAQELRAGIEENFWPLLIRGGFRVRVEVVDGDVISTEVVDPEDTYAELARALRRFDAGDIDADLSAADSVVVRDVPIKISRRRTGDGHPSFVHQAKLVVTLSDDQKDTLENRVCLLRQPEMIVQTVDRSFDGHIYHAFLLAGAAITPHHPSTEDLLADDFLRFAEPPAHDRWIPGTGRRQASQANLTAHYQAPWVPNLQGIEKGVIEALIGLFGAPPPPPQQAPQSLLRHLRFLRGEQGGPGGAGGAPHKPDADISRWHVEDGRWHVQFEVRAKNRPNGWTMTPALALVGLDGGRDIVGWESLSIAEGDGVVVDGIVHLPPTARGRFVKVSVQGVSSANLPIPAEEAAVEVVLRNIGPLAAAGEQRR